MYYTVSFQLPHVGSSLSASLVGAGAVALTAYHSRNHGSRLPRWAAPRRCNATNGSAVAFGLATAGRIAEHDLDPCLRR